MVDARYAQSRMALKDWRVKVLSMTQEEFVAHLRSQGVKATLSAVSLWEHGKRTPRVTTRRDIARALGLKPWQIAWAGETVADVSEDPALAA